MSKATLFTLPASHPGMSTELMLKFKGIEYRRIDLLPAVHRTALRVLRFPGKTVPALKFNGETLQGSVPIARALDRLVPEPPLLPPDDGDPASSERRATILKAETFGEQELQQPIRQIIWWLLKRDRSTMATFLEHSTLPLPKDLAAKTAAPLVIASARFNQSTDDNVRIALRGLPGMLNLLDTWIEDGVIGGETPNAADFQIAPSIGLAMTMDDLRSAIESRPIGILARRIVPDFPGRLGPGLPAAWLEPLRSAS